MKNLKLIYSAFIILVLFALPASTAWADSPQADWWAEYFNNPALQGEPLTMVHESAINHDWGYYAPANNIASDYFSVRWTTTTQFEAGHYTFSVTADDGVRVWVDGNLLIDQWHVQSVKTFTTKTWLSGGKHTVQVAYFEYTGEAVAKFWWRQDPPPPPPPYQPPHPPKTEKLIIDNRSSGFIWGGPPRYRHSASGGYNHGFYWTQNTVTHPVNYGQWIPTFNEHGWYEVLVYVPSSHATTAQVRYRIFHNGQRDDVLLDQDWYYNQWVSLGTYYFNAHNTRHEFVIAYDNTREPYSSTSIAFDAIKFVKR